MLVHRIKNLIIVLFYFMEKRTAMILMIAGGAFYIAGGVVGAYVIAVLKGVEMGLVGGSEEEVWAAITPVIATGLVTGLLIVLGGVLVNSESRKNRVIGSILGIVMALLGAINTFGGLIIGIVLAFIGSVAGLTYKQSMRASLSAPSHVQDVVRWEVRDAQSSPAPPQLRRPASNEQSAPEPGWYLFQHEGDQHYWCYYDGEKWLTCRWASPQPSE
ncbi:hypothetical protein CGL51_09040 [Pyrobaculum aerophilum]|uniref:DUF4064 domain-containing protein n=2 Tax=Pyrobaculum aerophilum TaxID=13773 RepID=A0A371R0A7_9CREN|nr:hypothetical protein CGL51_09040 [Pyrobaculum aerophilum]RFA96716.1 hypothetical protein CGL52_10760 [Pyrobaculum aerophilum]